MNNTQMMAALAALPDVELLQAGKIDDPLGANEFYSARTVVRLLKEERMKCAKKCRDIARDLGAEPTYAGIAEQCATAIEGHNYPLQGKTVSGLHVENNLQILTRAKNRSKGNR